VSNATQAFQSVFAGASLSGASLSGAMLSGAMLSGAVLGASVGAAVGAVVGAEVADEPEQAAIRMADATPRAVSLRDTCNVYSSYDPGHPRHGTGPAVL
jgi:uncharacterized protein YjbI with pentapeptide repeats